MVVSEGILVQYQLNVQAEVIGLISLISLLITLAVPNSRSLCFYIYKNATMAISLSELMIVSSYLVKLNSQDCISSNTEIPSWVIPWWNTITVLCLINIILIMGYCCMIMFYGLKETRPKYRPNIYETSDIIQNCENRRLYLSVSVITYISLFLVFIVVLFLNIFICDPGEC